MILEFKIKNFRSYKDEVVFSMEANSSEAKAINFLTIENSAGQEFKLLKTAMIYGPNASGKTTVIRALYEVLYLIKNKPSVNDWLRISDPFQLDEESAQEPSEFSLTFLGPEFVKYSYSFKVSESVILEEELNYYPNGKISNVFKRSPYQPENTVQQGQLGDGFGKKKINVFENQLILSKFGDDEPHEVISKIFLFFNKYRIINATNEKHLDSIERNTSKLLVENEHLLKKVKRLIQWGDTKIDDIVIVEQIFDKRGQIIREDAHSQAGKPYDVFSVHKRYKNEIVIGTHSMEFKDWSHGTQSLYKLGGEIILTLENGGVLIVDELDTSLHPFLTKLIVMLFQSPKTNPHDAQLIFTTHDVTLLDRDLIRRDQVWLAEKSERGVSELYSLQDFDDVREDTPFERWYLAGKFGGIPTINSIESIFQFD